MIFGVLQRIAQYRGVPWIASALLASCVMAGCGSAPSRPATPSAGGAQRPLSEKQYAGITISTKRSQAEREEALLHVEHPRLLSLIVERADSFGWHSLAGKAMDRINDEATLTELAIDHGQLGKGGSHWNYLRTRAVERLKDQRSLARVVLTAKRASDKAANTALDRLTDSRLLAKVEDAHPLEWFRSKANVRSQVVRVETSTDPEVWRRAVFEHTPSPVKLAGVERIVDPQTLADIAIAETMPREIRLHAVRRLADQRQLADVVRRTPDEYTTRVAFDQITEQFWLERMAIEGYAPAVDRLQGTESVERVALSAKTNWSRIKALHRLGDSALVRARAVDDPSWEVRKAAVNEVQDPGLLARVAESDPIWRVRYAALGRVTDPAVLRRAAMRGRNQWERLDATARIGDQDLLRQLLDRPDGQGAVAALRLSLQEIGGLTPAFSLKLREIEKRYFGSGTGKPGSVGVTMYGEEIRLVLSGEPLAKPLTSTYTTDFPTMTAMDRKTLEKIVAAPEVEREIWRAKWTPHDVADFLSRFLGTTVTEPRRAEFAQPGRPPLLRAAALMTLDSQALLRTAIEDQDPLVRGGAIRNLADAAILARIAKHDSDDENRIAAIGKVRDIELLRSIVREEKGEFWEEVGIAAARRMNAIRQEMPDQPDGPRSLR